ncbi:SDR family NAD(P)-dependent oxidoreductase [Jannaschia pohangensis]|uniref:Short-chain dehydrogenase n=1 Tax=Jannaschia pohangensis TaxID=390807 RepID=A0A1I3SJ05_9RHOB|nr:SDR family NAD(P)-dependent oxidoreductase [Jannaschia pohangensis]SFJ58704.1 Short-chain dehydrogenase [Jannaschia pohangensis]
MRALVTGASRGIGAALVTEGQARGYEVWGTVRAGEGLLLDVTDAAAQARVAAEVGPLDLLVCNAGVYLDKGLGLSDLTFEGLQETFAANVAGVALTVQAQLRNLSPRSRVAIISSRMGSSTAVAGNAFAYRASKAAALNLGLNLAQALRDHGVAVGIYHPGWVQTDMGGAEAEVTSPASARGLWDRFEALDMARTGVFEDYRGRALAP